MKTGVIFLNIGTRCLVRLAVSIHSLRKHYGGRVCVVNAAELDNGIVDKFAADPSILVDVKHIPIKTYRRRSAYVAKPSIYRWTPFDRSLFVDADTVFRADPSPLIYTEPPIVFTQFSDWNCGGRIVSNRIEPFRKIECLPFDVPALARQVVAENWPAINTGVFVFDRKYIGMEYWESLTKAARTKANFTDEIAANVLLPEFVGKSWPIEGERWNWSPIYGKSANPAIVHFHGKKHLRPEAMPHWLPVFRECVELNVANIQSWMPAGDNRLAEFLSAENSNVGV